MQCKYSKKLTKVLIFFDFIYLKMIYLSTFCQFKYLCTFSYYKFRFVLEHSSSKSKKLHIKVIFHARNRINIPFIEAYLYKYNQKR